MHHEAALMGYVADDGVSMNRKAASGEADDEMIALADAHGFGDFHRDCGKVRVLVF